MSSPNLIALLWSHWQPSWGLEVQGAFWALLYLLCARRVRRGWPVLRTTSFLLGIACALIALQSGLDTFDTQLLSAHMIQHLLLIEVAPLLLVGGRPALLALQAAPVSHRPSLARGLRRLRPLTGAVACLILYSAVVLGTHVPAVQDATVRTPLLHDAEHAAYLLAGLLLWWPIVDGDPVSVRRLTGLGRLVYVMAAMGPMELIGAYLNRQTTLFYGVYAVPAHALHLSAVIDQQRAGAIMWAGSGMIMVIVGVWQALGALVAEERRQQARERRLDARMGVDVISDRRPT